MADDWAEIVDLGEGIYEVKYHKLSLKALRNKRTRLTNEIFGLRRKIRGARINVEDWREQIKQKEAMLNTLTEEKLAAFQRRELQKQVEINRKANAFLESYIGTTAFQQLQEKGSFEFKGLDGATYRIKQNGQLQRADGNYWHNMCFIEPDLPLPDIIASVFTATTQSPKFLKESQPTKTEEVVS